MSRGDGISKDERKSYNDGRREAEFIREHPISYIFTGGVRSRPDDEQRGAAYDKGMKNEQLDGDKGCESSGGSSGCFITTACLREMGQDIASSPEFNAIKEMTRNHILSSFSGRRDYVRYQREAPRIVRAINERADSKSLWAKVYGLLGEISRIVKSGDYNRSYVAYRELVKSLKGSLSIKRP